LAREVEQDMDRPIYKFLLSYINAGILIEEIIKR